MNKDKGTVFYNKKYAMTMMLVGIVGFIVNVIFALFMHVSIGPSIPFFVLFLASFALHYSPYVIIKDDVITNKPTPIKAKISVPFNQITQMRYQDKKYYISYRKTEQSNQQELVIYLSGLKTEDANELLRILDSLAQKCLN